MEYNLKIGGIHLQINSEIDLLVEESLIPFLSERIDKPEIKVDVFSEKATLQIEKAIMCGEDLLLEHYCENGEFYCLAKGGAKKYLATTIYDNHFTELKCYINTEDFHAPIQSLGNLLRVLPMRMMLQKRGVMFFHAAQIVVQGKGILFSGPSGIGKTTQAKMWEKYRKAKIVCNDRTLIRGEQTYGYPIDGSEPVISGESFALGAMIVLEQSSKNEIIRLKPGAAMAKLLSQMVLDTWSAKARELAIMQLTELLEYYPVYLFRCTPNESAVYCLEKELMKAGIL